MPIFPMKKRQEVRWMVYKNYAALRI
ncbi:hypothetical protein Gotur_033077 [Gossypium turneri]